MTSRTAAIIRNQATASSPSNAIRSDAAPSDSVPSDAILERLSRLHPKVIDLSLGRIERLLYRLGNPEANLPPVVHVAGTNGKGSVIAYLRAMLEAAGRRVHVYTSPHLVRFNERIRLTGRLVEEAELVSLLEECELANGETPITFFEVTTAAAFLAFTRHPADILLLETGLGGRLDATNVVDQPLLSMITPVSIDHVQFLGETMAEIAFEKAGILKPGIPAVIGAQPETARKVIEARATKLGVPLLRAGQEWSWQSEDGAIVFRGKAGSSRFAKPCLPGAHQRENAALALAASELLAGFGIDDRARRRGLAEADWPGRLQRLTQGALPGRLPDGWELWLDGGHNAAAGQVLAAELAGWGDRPVHLVFGMMNTKAVGDFLEPLGGLADSLTAVTIPGEANALGAEEAAAEARTGGFAAGAAADLGSAMGEIVAQAERPGRILICGSLYLAGRVLAENS